LDWWKGIKKKLSNLTVEVTFIDSVFEKPRQNRNCEYEFWFVHEKLVSVELQESFQALGYPSTFFIVGEQKKDSFANFTISAKTLNQHFPIFLYCFQRAGKIDQTVFQMLYWGKSLAVQLVEKLYREIELSITRNEAYWLVDNTWKSYLEWEMLRELLLYCDFNKEQIDKGIRNIDSYQAVLPFLSKVEAIKERGIQELERLSDSRS